MATLSENAPRSYQLGSEGLIPMVGTDIIYEGAAVGTSSGLARPLEAADPFAGFAMEKADNSAGSAGDKSVRVRARGRVSLVVTGVTGVGDLGAKVYASDDDSFTLTATDNSLIGVVSEHVSGTTVIVEFDAGSVKLNA